MDFFYKLWPEGPGEVWYHADIFEAFRQIRTAATSSALAALRSLGHLPQGGRPACRKSPSPPPGVVLRAANLKSNDCRGQSHHNSQVAPKGSGEECGQKSKSQHHSKSCKKVGCGTKTPISIRFFFVQSYRPISSSVSLRSTASPPGEAIGCCRTRGFFDSLTFPKGEGF